jgi:hypothetical protein
MHAKVPRLDEILGYVRKKVEESDSAPRRNFRDIIQLNWRARTDILRSPGVYILYKGSNPITLEWQGNASTP